MAEKILEKKCTCEDSTGSTTVECCNVCGWPLPHETWHFVEEDYFVRMDKPANEFPETTRKIVDVDKLTEDVLGEIVDNSTIHSPDSWRVKIHKVLSAALEK